MILIREYDFRENKKATYTKLITGLLAATPPSIRLNFLTLPDESLVSKLWAGKYVGAAEVPMHISESKASKCAWFFT